MKELGVHLYYVLHLYRLISPLSCEVEVLVKVIPAVFKLSNNRNFFKFILMFIVLRTT